MSLPYPSLTSAQRNLYFAALGNNALVYSQIQTLTLSHALVSSLNTVYIDGQVNINDTDGAQKVLSCGFRDPGHQLRLDAASPYDGVNSLDRLIRVTQHVFVRPLNDWVSVDVATCRPTVVNRDGEIVTVEAQSKESLHLRKVPSYTIKKGTNVVNAIKYILTKSGETRFRLPVGHKARLPKDVHVGGPDDTRQPWLVARRLAKSLSYQLFYDGPGYACLRAYPSAAAWRLIDIDDGGVIGPNLLAPVKTSTDLSAIRNRVVVTYHTTATKKKKSQSLAVALAADPKHPFSAQSLAMNGVSWFSTEFYDQTNIHTEAKAREFARKQLTEKLTQGVKIEARIIPVWHLIPSDVLAVKTREASFNVRLSEASVPLGPSDEGMTIGYQKFVRRAATGLIKRAA